jgi:hypothetical protein
VLLAGLIENVFMLPMAPMREVKGSVICISSGIELFANSHPELIGHDILHG